MHLEFFEGWVIGWPPGGAVELHDHGESGGAVVVADGELVEMVLAEDGQGTLAMTNTMLPVSASTTFDKSRIHEIVSQDRSGHQRACLCASAHCNDLLRNSAAKMFKVRKTVLCELGAANP